MFGLSKTFVLDPRLEADTFDLPIGSTYTTRLMNDRRWPWVIVVPRENDLVDIDDLATSHLHPLGAHLSNISRTLKAMAIADSTNVATLGNMVTQMHWHVVGRREGDPNWPGPVWGFGEREPYQPDERSAFISRFDRAWNDTVPLLERLP